MLTRRALLNMLCTEAYEGPRGSIGCIDRCSPVELKEVRRIYQQAEMEDRMNDPEFLEREKEYLAWLNGEENAEDDPEIVSESKTQES